MRAGRVPLVMFRGVNPVLPCPIGAGRRGARSCPGQGRFHPAIRRDRRALRSPCCPTTIRSNRGGRPGDAYVVSLQQPAMESGVPHACDGGRPAGVAAATPQPLADSPPRLSLLADQSVPWGRDGFATALARGITSGSAARLPRERPLRLTPRGVLLPRGRGDSFLSSIRRPARARRCEQALGKSCPIHVSKIAGVLDRVASRDRARLDIHPGDVIEVQGAGGRCAPRRIFIPAFDVTP